MDTQRSAEIQVVLEGVTLPATRRELIVHARRYDPDAATALARIPDRSYDSIDDVGDELQGHRRAPQKAPPIPAPTSGLPPGGRDYTNPAPESGGVTLSAPEDNPAEKTLLQQSQTQKRQAAVQQGKPLPGPLTTS